MEIAILLAVVVLGLIPAFIASSKGHNFIVWWLFGSLLFIIALPVAILIQPNRPAVSEVDAIDKLDKLNRLRAEGVIGEHEFERMRAQTLAASRPAARHVSGYDPTVPPNPEPTRIILYGLGIAAAVFALLIIVL